MSGYTQALDALVALVDDARFPAERRHLTDARQELGRAHAYRVDDPPIYKGSTAATPYNEVLQLLAHIHDHAKNRVEEAFVEDTIELVCCAQHDRGVLNDGALT